MFILSRKNIKNNAGIAAFKLEMYFHCTKEEKHPKYCKKFLYNSIRQYFFF